MLLSMRRVPSMAIAPILPACAKPELFSSGGRDELALRSGVGRPPAWLAGTSPPAAHAGGVMAVTADISNNISNVYLGCMRALGIICREHAVNRRRNQALSPSETERYSPFSSPRKRGEWLATPPPLAGEGKVGNLPRYIMPPATRLAVGWFFYCHAEFISAPTFPFTECSSLLHRGCRNNPRLRGDKVRHDIIVILGMDRNV